MQAFRLRVRLLNFDYLCNITAKWEKIKQSRYVIIQDELSLLEIVSKLSNSLMVFGMISDNINSIQRMYPAEKKKKNVLKF